jgi:ribosome biogenesis GTPase / thiamine phosphate phosphatase
MTDSKSTGKTIEGRIIRAESGRFLVDTGEVIIPCTLRGKIKKRRERSVRNVVVGDLVMLQRTGTAPNPESEGVIEELLPRRTRLSRASPGGAKREQVLMANLESLFVVMATHQPDFNPRLLDRFLVASSFNRLDAVICLNKCDLVDAEAAQVMLAPYQTAGYPTLLLSATSGVGLDGLLEVMTGKMSLFLGPSGVGKSSLLAAIQSGLELATRTISQATGKGRHATSYTELHKLDGGGYVADSPGVREFGLWGMEERDLPICFPEFHPWLGNCRFPDCSHSHEPDCGLKEAVEAGEINSGRYESYLRILESIREGRLSL